MIRSKKLELLAPAGDFKTLKAVIHAGADAVYFGGSRFGARAYAGNLNREEVLEAIDFGHIHGRRMMLTVNTLLKEEEIQEQLYEYLLPFYDQGLDAVIVQDFGVMHFIRSHFPGLSIHTSTQMTVTGAEGAEFLAQEGASRVVLARELSLAEIQKIHRKTPVELECFVHGALCYSYSGQCLFSSLLGGRSGNRGRCAQPCRLSYDIYGSDFQKISDKRHGYPLSPKDLCAIELLPELAESGVYSFKIEGRMKQTEYAAGVTAIYRKYIDRYFNYGEEGYIVAEQDKKLLLDLGSRCGFTRGYYKQKNGPDMITFFKSAHENKSESVPDLPEEQKEKIKGSIEVKKDQPIKLTVSFRDAEAVVTGEMPKPAESRPLTEEILKARLNKTGNTPFSFETIAVELEEGLFLSMSSLNELRREALDQLKEAYLGRYRRRRAKDPFITGEVMPLAAPGEKQNLQEQKEPPDRETFACGYPFLCQELYRSGKLQDPKAKQILLSASAEREDQIPPLLESLKVSRIYIDSSVFPRKETAGKLEALARQVKERKKKLYYVLPAVFRDHTAAFYRSVLHDMQVDGFLVKNYDALAFLLKENIDPHRIRLDHNLYTWSTESRSAFYVLGIEGDTVPLELNRKEVKNRINRNSEMIIYGRQPLMISAQCIKKNLTGCDGVPEIRYLKDRYNISFPVKNHCNECYNVIYNSRPLHMLSILEDLRGYGITSFRLSFTTESKGQTEKVLETYEKHPVFLNKETPLEKRRTDFIEIEMPNVEYTYGHYKRGVE